MREDRALLSPQQRAQTWLRMRLRTTMLVPRRARGAALLRQHVEPGCSGRGATECPAGRTIPALVQLPCPSPACDRDGGNPRWRQRNCCTGSVGQGWPAQQHCPCGRASLCHPRDPPRSAACAPESPAGAVPGAVMARLGSRRGAEPCAARPAAAVPTPSTRGHGNRPGARSEGSSSGKISFQKRFLFFLSFLFPRKLRTGARTCPPRSPSAGCSPVPRHRR